MLNKAGGSEARPGREKHRLNATSRESWPELMICRVDKMETGFGKKSLDTPSTPGKL